MKDRSKLAISLVAASAVMVLSTNALSKAFDIYLAESACVNSLITVYDRSQIETSNGTCWVTE